MEGISVPTEGLGSEGMVTEGYGYIPRATDSALRGDAQPGLAGTPSLLHLKDAIANAFTSLRPQFGEQVSVESLWRIVDEVILSQPGIYKAIKLDGVSPGTLAQMAYRAGG